MSQRTPPFYVKAYRADGTPTVNDAREYFNLVDALMDMDETAASMSAGHVTVTDHEGVIQHTKEARRSSRR
jgi:hypothetical protein